MQFTVYRDGSMYVKHISDGETLMAESGPNLTEAIVCLEILRSFGTRVGRSMAPKAIEVRSLLRVPCRAV